MDIDQLIGQSVHRVIVTGCTLCNPPDNREGLAEYLGKLEDIERAQPSIVNRTGTYRTLKTHWDLPIGNATVNSHFNEHL